MHANTWSPVVIVLENRIILLKVTNSNNDMYEHKYEIIDSSSTESRWFWNVTYFFSSYANSNYDCCHSDQDACVDGTNQLNVNGYWGSFLSIKRKSKITAKSSEPSHAEKMGEKRPYIHRPFTSNTYESLIKRDEEEKRNILVQMNHENKVHVNLFTRPCDILYVGSGN